MNIEKNEIIQTRAWIQQIIVDLNFCPFAKKEMVNNTIHYYLSHHKKLKLALTELFDEVQVLKNTPEIETSLVIYSDGFKSFEQYLELVDYANDLLIDSEFDGKLPSLTAKAKIFILQNLEPNQFFRFAVAGGGCSGFNYLFEAVDVREDDDITFCTDPVAIIDPESLKFLYGSSIDLEDSGMNKMLKVVNPGAKASCGCGTSFAFDEELLDLYENV